LLCKKPGQAWDTKANKYNIVDTVYTSDVYFANGGPSVDWHLSHDVDSYYNGGFGSYLFLWNDCGTIGNSWLRHARDVLKQAEDSWPDPVW